jgi:hypothetical protein
MPRPAVTGINMTGVSPMSFSYRPAQAFFGMGYTDKMDMVRHQAICPNLHFTTIAPIRHKI